MRLASVSRELRSWSISHGDELWGDVSLSLNSVMVDQPVGWADGVWLLRHSGQIRSLNLFVEDVRTLPAVVATMLQLSTTDPSTPD